MSWRLLIPFAALTLGGCGTLPSPPERQAPRQQAANPAPAKPQAAYNRPYVVKGAQYSPLASAVGYQARGLASWYGPESGRTTSMGTPFDPDGLSAAHRTLPLPTLVRVTRLDTGKSLVLPVTDRGPFREDRLIDLSRGAARMLGITGTAEVEVTALVDPVTNPLPTGTVALPMPALDAGLIPSREAVEQGGRTTQWAQLGTFREASNVRRLVARLKSAGFQVRVLRSAGLSRVQAAVPADEKPAALRQLQNLSGATPQMVN